MCHMEYFSNNRLSTEFSTDLSLNYFKLFSQLSNFIYQESFLSERGKSTMVIGNLA